MRWECFTIAVRYLQQLGKEDRFRAIVSPHRAEVLLVAALLHDLGHWPFCHPIEDIDLPELPSHEQFAAQFLVRRERAGPRAAGILGR